MCLILSRNTRLSIVNEFQLCIIPACPEVLFCFKLGIRLCGSPGSLMQGAPGLLRATVQSWAAAPAPAPQGKPHGQAAGEGAVTRGAAPRHGFLTAQLGAVSSLYPGQRPGRSCRGYSPRLCSFYILTVRERSTIFPQNFQQLLLQANSLPWRSLLSHALVSMPGEVSV